MLSSRLLGVILLVSGTYALYDSSSDVVQLTPSNFERLVSNSDEVWIVEFFAPWCGHCKNLVPEYKKAARALKGIAKVGAVDADQYKELAQKYGVSGFPTIKIFIGSKHSPYQGQRTAESFVDAALKAAKEKAYENLGKKPSGSSGKKRVYGHFIPWRSNQRSRVTNIKKQIDRPQITLSLNRIRFKALQAKLFHGEMFNIKPKIIQSNISKLRLLKRQ